MGSVQLYGVPWVYGFVIIFIFANRDIDCHEPFYNLSISNSKSSRDYQTLIKSTPIAVEILAMVRRVKL